MIRVAVDGSALHSPHSGIGRYLASLLRRMPSMDGGLAWSIYCRASAGMPSWFADAAVNVHADRLPVDAGRIASLFTSQPWWALRERPDLFWGPAHRLPAWLPASTARVVTVHDLCWLQAPRTMRRSTRLLDASMMPRALRSADRIIAVSAAIRDEVCAAFPAVSERIVVVHEAAERLPAPMPVTSLEALGVRLPFVLFVGTAEPRKNLAMLVDAFARLPVMHRQATQLVVAGHAGWGDVAVSALAAKHGIADRVLCLRAVSDAVLATLYQHARLLALPSLYEGFGLPLVEAMAHGTPVLTSCRGAMAEVAGSAGVLVEPEDADAIRDGLQRLLADDDAHARLCAEARVRSAQFDWDVAAGKTLAVLREAVVVRGRMGGRSG